MIIIKKKTKVGIYSDGDPARTESAIRSALAQDFTEPVIFLQPDEKMLNSSFRGFQSHVVGSREQAREILKSKSKSHIPFLDEVVSKHSTVSKSSEVRISVKSSDRGPLLVAIPARDCEELTFRCLEHLAQHAGLSFFVLYIDDGSQDGVAERVEQKATSLRIPIDVLRFEEPIGFAKACNIAFSVPYYQHVLLLNNDCFVGPDCLTRMRDWLESDSEVAAVGPMTGDDGCLSLIRADRQEQSGISTKMTDRYDPLEGARLCQANKATSEPMLPFFCTMFRSDAIQEIGFQSTDPDYAFGLGADDDWCQRATNQGWKLLACGNAFAAHLHKQSFQHHQINRDELTQTAMQRFQSRRETRPTLSIVTRCHVDRPQGFENLRQSIEEQTSIGIQHVLLHSPGQIGISGANRLLATDEAVSRIKGDYVQVIDDDDVLSSPDYLDQLQTFIVSQGFPDWILVRGKINEREYPTPWGPKWKPVLGTVACFCIITSRRLWQEHHQAWGVDKCGDWNYAKALWDAGNRPVWFDFDGCETQHGHSNGGGECDERRAA
ncbi:glycosyltransferase family 2 protein [Gimesia aquarii]|uniref:Glycosyl transferase family 2 n=1 Tax=Gimesia aquarii TaxID=2527964 RepID=A0A517VRK7_9PLAN|nr:glycosyltransferase [Gimesia aquarii]QDT95560.1 Glycosyl transferase family 2 [Gimesia aquarii]